MNHRNLLNVKDLHGFENLEDLLTLFEDVLLK
jgi:hypothetical protein